MCKWSKRHLINFKVFGCGFRIQFFFYTSQSLVIDPLSWGPFKLKLLGGLSRRVLLVVSRVTHTLSHTWILYIIRIAELARTSRQQAIHPVLRLRMATQSTYHRQSMQRRSDMRARITTCTHVERSLYKRTQFFAHSNGFDCLFQIVWRLTWH